LAVKINGNRGAQQEICFNKSFKRNCTISTGIPNLGIGNSCDVKNNPIGYPESESDKKSTTPTPSVVRNPTPTPPKNSLRFRLRLRNPILYSFFLSAKARQRKARFRCAQHSRRHGNHYPLPLPFSLQSCTKPFYLGPAQVKAEKYNLNIEHDLSVTLSTPYIETLIKSVVGLHAQQSL